MTVFQRMGMICVALVGLLLIDGLLREQSYVSFPSFTSEANARVGRPLTPVSVAGVARRTTRRCAAGVYNC
jgi:hypothetical protein